MIADDGPLTVTASEWLAAVDTVVRAAGSARAVHRPLLLLYLLGRAQRREPREVPFVGGRAGDQERAARQGPREEGRASPPVLAPAELAVLADPRRRGASLPRRHRATHAQGHARSEGRAATSMVGGLARERRAGRATRRAHSDSAVAHRRRASGGGDRSGLPASLSRWLSEQMVPRRSTWQCTSWRDTTRWS
jgi:hypothetical protein